MGNASAAIKSLDRSNPNNKFSIVSELGSGSYGKVYKVKDRHSGEISAAKVADLDSKERLNEFDDELTILTTRHHMGITGFVAGFFHENTLWIVLELCEGGSLNDVLRKRQTGIPEDAIRCIACQSLTALAYLHRNRVIHRDINASNIMVSASGLIKIGDFGVSAALKSDTERRSTFIGTPNWMAPEVVVCEKDTSASYDFKIDVWSFGCTVIELAERQPPFNDMHPVKALLRIANGPPPTLSEPSEWSPDMSAFLTDLLIRDPERRPTAVNLVQHMFCKSRLDREPILALL